MALVDDLKEIIKGDVSNTPAEIARVSKDASLFRATPQCVVKPKNSQEICTLVKFCNAHREKKYSLTARSAGTDMSGGPLSESIILDMTTHFNKIIKVGDHYATTQPGVYYRDFEKETLRHNLLMPSYPASRELCTVGGMVANNSGGEKTLQYGKTNRYVRALKIVLADGNEYSIKPLNASELEKKTKEKSFLGSALRKLSALIKKNQVLIEKARPKVSKNSSGYALWNIWDTKTGIFDLNQLFVGSQGTLGIITEINFRLITPNPHKTSLIIFLKDSKVLDKVVTTVLSHHPESFESYDDQTLHIALKYLPEFMKILHPRNMVALGLQFLPELKMILTGGMPKLILIAQFTGQDPNAIKQQAIQCQKDLARYNLNTRITKDEKEANKYFAIRRESFNLLRHHVRGKRTAPFIDDIVVAPQFLPQFLPQLATLLKPYEKFMTYTIAGHVGDGNFHIIPLVDPHDPELVRIIPELSHKVFALVFKYGGSMSGEHNDGIVRTPYLEQMYGKKIVTLFQKVKDIFDPYNIFNPGKKVGGTLEYAMRHLQEE